MIYCLSCSWFYRNLFLYIGVGLYSIGVTLFSDANILLVLRLLVKKHLVKRQLAK
jgi:hypothetical protein